MANNAQTNMANNAFQMFLSEPQTVVNEIRLKQETKKDVNKVVHEVAEVIRTHIKPIRIVKGGSHGKGTSLYNRLEVDLVVIVGGIAPNSTCFNEVLTKWKDLVSSGLAMNSPVSNPNATQNKIEARTYSVYLKYKGVEFDILPGIELTPQDYAKYTPDQRKFLSASAAKYQTVFIKHQPAQYKDLVRYCKQWRKLQDWTDKDAPTDKKEKKFKPSSYLIELLCLKAFENMTQRNVLFQIRTAFREFLRLVLQPDIKLLWDHHYSGSNLMSLQGRVIVDPGNPFNNIADALPDWTKFVMHTQETESMLTHQLRHLVLKDMEAELQALQQQVTKKSAEIQALKTSK